MKMHYVALIALLCTAVLTAGSDWPMWGRVPSRNMVSPDAKNLPADFKSGDFKGDTEIIDMATTENVKWVAKMGSITYGNPTVANGRVYVGTNNDGRDDSRFEGDFSLLKCLDEKTGKVLWTLTVPKLGSGKVGDWEYLGICSSPAIEGDRVYVATNRCEIMCLDAQGLTNGNQGDTDEAQYMAGPGKPPIELKDTDADILWRFNMAEELGVFPHNITSTSPLIVGDLVYCATSNGVDWSHTNIPNPKAPAFCAVNKMTGELAGEEASGCSQRILHSNWNSLAYGKLPDGRGLLLFGGPEGVMYAFDPIPVKDEDGFGVFKEVWRYDCNPPSYRFEGGDPSKPIKYATPMGPSEIIATPVYHDGKVYVPIGQDPEHGEGLGNFSCIDATGKGDVTATHKVWESREVHRSLSTSSIVDGLVFIADYSGFVYCFDAKTGEQYWKYDTLSHIWGSTLVADGKVYIGNEDGDIIILEAGKEMKELGRVTFIDPIYSSPIAAGDTLYVTTTTQLYAISK